MAEWQVTLAAFTRQLLQHVMLHPRYSYASGCAVAVVAEKAIMQKKASAGGVPTEVLQSINEQLTA